MSGSEFCYLHNPDIPADEKKASQTRGGANRALMTVSAPLPPMILRQPNDAIELIEDTINRVRAGELDIKIANCLGVLAGHLIKAFEVSKLNDKVEEITRVIEKRTKYK
jgi:hypothetical protein